MKKILALLIISFFLISCKNGQNKSFIVESSKSSFSIILDKNSDSLSYKAASELQNYIAKVSGAKLKISTTEIEGDKHIYIGKRKAKQRINLLPDSLKEDAFIIDYDGNDLFLFGRNGKADLYAVYTFIEEFLGCRLLAPGEEFIPESKSISIPKITKVYEPAFSFRRTLFPGLFDKKYRYWHKIEEMDEWGMFVHTFQHLVPPKTYFQAYPEYFSLIGGHRLSDGQLCLSNPELIELLKDNLRKEIAKKPSKKYWSVSQNDCYNYCECDNCQKMYDKYGEISGAYIYMSNELARTFPDKEISTLAYQFTRSAPKNIKPDKNVNIMFCSIECNRSQALAEDKRSASFVKDMKDWSQLTTNIFLWDYVVQFKNYMTPFPNFHVLQPNILFFQEHGVDMMFQQGSSRNWSDLSNLKQYMISKLLWNPDVDVDKLTNEYLELYYGPASAYIQSYCDLMHVEIKKVSDKEFLNIYGFPMDHLDAHLSPELMVRYKEIMDQAEKAVQGDSIYLKRVLKTRLAVDFAYLDISLNLNKQPLSFFVEQDGEKVLNKAMLTFLNKWYKNSVLTNTTCINERNFQTLAYRDYALHKLKQMEKNNLAKDAKIDVSTIWSETYPVGGPLALNDGLFGDLDFHNNWLGFQGYDMECKLELQELKEVKQVSMNFLKAVNSWVFLPEKIVIEGSSDGKSYRKLAEIEGDNSDRSYLVKSIPFVLNFEPINLQYIRINAISMKECPEWHRGFGNPSWIFVDEIVVE